MKTMNRILVLAVVAGLSAVAAGCATTADLMQTYDFNDDSAAQGFAQWLDGERPETEAPTSPEEFFLAGEVSFGEGDLEDAYQWYVSMLHEHPGHALNRYAAFRLYRLRNDIVNFADRAAEDLAGISYDDEAPLTRLELTRLSHEVSRQSWRKSDSEAPFVFEHGGTIDLWTATPVLSPWRLGDFDTVMAPEHQTQLSNTYRSPMMATDSEANYDTTKVVFLDRPRSRLGLGGTGIYYLESQLTVEGNQAREMTVNGHFPGAAKLWIDGEQILERREEDYRSGRLSRAVKLEPGTHRVLVKMAYQPNSRDWFELFFVPTSGEIFSDAGFRVDVELTGDTTGVELQGPQRRTTELEPVQVDRAAAATMSGPMLYAAAVSAYASDDTAGFSASWDELMKRHPAFAAGHLLGSYQVRTRWDMPSELRDAASISRIRQAQQADPDNLHVLVQLERWLRDQGAEREHKRVLKRSRELALDVDNQSAAGSSSSDFLKGSSGAIEDPGARSEEETTVPVRQLRPLVSWARNLESQGWSKEAEEAWKEVLGADQRHCSAMRRLQGLYRSRHYVPAPASISEHWQSCPNVVRQWLSEDPDRLEERRDFARREAQRYPYDTTRQLRYAEQLRAVGQRVEAAHVLDETIERVPHSGSAWRARIDLAIGDNNDELARKLLDQATDTNGPSSELEWMRERFEDGIPLQSLMRDGHAAAMEEVRRTGEGSAVDAEEVEGDQAMVLDDAYYVVDFVGRKYFEDGSSWTLTHRVIRTMTRGAIDRYAELTVPRGAHLLIARTIKEDGEIRVPDGVSGDSTMSMPGLARGDMVEVAFLQFQRPTAVSTHRAGSQFFFQMPNISSRYSEFVIAGSDGFEFETANGAPEPEYFEWEGMQATRFVAEDTRRPRSESRLVNGQEFLPWVREIRVGVEGDVLDVERRYMKDAVQGSARRSAVVNHHIEEWLGRSLDEGRPDDEEVRRLFYGITSWFRSHSSGSFRTDAAHAVQQRRGSPVIVMHAALNTLGVDHDIYLARSDEEPPTAQKIGEIGRYRHTLMRVVMPDSGEVKWLDLGSRDAMFGALDPEVDGEPAICVTCESSEARVVTGDDDRRSSRHIELDGDLDEEGTLSGRLKYEFNGNRAVRVRSALRSRTDEQERESYFERVLTEQVSGADMIGFEVLGEDDPDQKLRFEIDFERTNFARAEQGRLVVDRVMFQEPMQRLYAQSSSRNLPMFIGYERNQTYSLTMALPAGMEAQLRAADVGADQGQMPFANFERRSWIDGDYFRIESEIALRRQRIFPDVYSDFRAWATTVENSASLWLGLE